MLYDRAQNVERFLENLHSGEYTVDPRASDIQYGGQSLASALSDALFFYERDPTFIHQVQLPDDTSERAFIVITAAFAHGIIIKKTDVQKQMQRTQELLNQKEADMQNCEKTNQQLRQLVADQAEKIKFLENRLSKYEPNGSGLFDK